nr:hypothetical protein CFP56_57948 [Quercus suber]
MLCIVRIRLVHTDIVISVWPIMDETGSVAENERYTQQAEGRFARCNQLVDVFSGSLTIQGGIPWLGSEPRSGTVVLTESLA